MSDFNLTPANGGYVPQSRRGPSAKAQLEVVSKRLTMLEGRSGLFGKVSPGGEDAAGRLDWSMASPSTASQSTVRSRAV